MGNVANASNTSRQEEYKRVSEVRSKTFKSTKKNNRPKEQRAPPSKLSSTDMHTTTEGCGDKKVMAGVANEPVRMDSKLNDSVEKLAGYSENSRTKNKRTDDSTGASLPLNSSSSNESSEDVTKTKTVWRGPKKTFLVDYRDDSDLTGNVEKESAKSHPVNAEAVDGNTEILSRPTVMTSAVDRNNSPSNNTTGTSSTLESISSSSSKPPISDSIAFDDCVSAIVQAEVDKTYEHGDQEGVEKDMDTIFSKLCDKRITKSADSRSVERSKEGLAPVRLTDEPHLKRAMNERQELEIVQEKHPRTYNNHYAHEPVPATAAHTGDQPPRKQGRYEVGAKEDGLKKMAAPPMHQLQDHQERNPGSQYVYYQSIGNQRASAEQISMHERTRSAGQFDLTSSRPRHSNVAAGSQQGSNFISQTNSYGPVQSQHQNAMSWPAISQASMGYPQETSRQYSPFQMARSTGVNVEKYPVGVNHVARNNYSTSSTSVATMKNRPSAGMAEERSAQLAAREDSTMTRMMKTDHNEHNEFSKYVRHQRQDNPGKYPSGSYPVAHRAEERQLDAAGRSYIENVTQGHESLLYAKQKGNIGSVVGAYDPHNPRSAPHHQQMPGSLQQQGQRSKQFHSAEASVHGRRTTAAAGEMYSKQLTQQQQQANEQRRSASISYHTRQSPHAAAAAAASAAAAAGMNRGRLHVNETHGNELGRRPVFGSYSESDTGLVPIEPNVQPRPSGSLAGPGVAKWPGSGAYADIMNMKSYYDATEPPSQQHERISNTAKRTFPFDAGEGESLAKKLNPLVVSEDFRSDGKRVPIHQAPRSGSFSPGSSAYFRPSVTANQIVEEDNGALDLSVKPEEKHTVNRKYLTDGRQTQRYNWPEGEGESFLRASGGKQRHEGRLEDAREGASCPSQWTNDSWNMREPPGINHGSAVAYTGQMFKMLSGPDGSPITREGLSRYHGGLPVEHGSGKASIERIYHEIPRSRANTMDHIRAPSRIFENQNARFNSHNDIQQPAARQYNDNPYGNRPAGAPPLAEGSRNKYAEDAPVLSRTGRRLEEYPQPSKLSVVTAYAEGNNKCAVTTSPNIPHLSPIQPLYQNSLSNAPKGLSTSLQIPPSNFNVAGLSNAIAANRRVPIVALLGAHDPSDILDLECKLCHSTHGSLRSFRIHFAKAHGLDPTADNFVVHTISDAKNAKIESKSPSSFACETDIANDREPPALIREAPMQENSLAVVTKHEVIDRPKQIAEVYPMLLSRQPPPAPPQSVAEHSAQCRKDSGDDSLQAKQDDKGAQCLRCQWLSSSSSSSSHNHGSGLVGSRGGGGQQTDSISGEAHCTTCMEGFRDISDCREHMLHSRIHVSSSMHMMRSCACKACDLGFTHAEALRAHLLKMHPPEEIANIGVEYRCLFCPAAFSDAEVLYRHTDEHERDYTSRHMALGSKTTGGLRKERNYIQTAIPDTTCLDDQKSVTSEHSSTKSPDSNNDGENTIADTGSSLKRKHVDALSVPTKELNSVTSHNQNIAREHPRAIYSSATDKPVSRKYSAVEGLLRDSASDSYPVRSSFSYNNRQGNSDSGRNQIDSNASGRNLGAKYSASSNSEGSSAGHRGRSSTSVSDYAFGIIRSTFCNRQDVEQLMKKRTDIDQSGDANKASLKNQNAQFPFRSEEMDKSRSPVETVSRPHEKIKIEQLTSQSSKMSSGESVDAASINNVSPVGGNDQRTDSIRYIIESLVAAEVKRTMNQHPSNWSAAIDSIASLSTDNPRNRTSSLSLPVTGSRRLDLSSEQFTTRPTTSTENYLARDDKGGCAQSAIDIGKNPTTAQLLQEARSYKPSSVANDSVPFASGQNSSQRANLQFTNSNQSRSSIKSETPESSQQQTSILKSECNATTSERTPLLRDIVSKMGQTVEINIRGGGSSDNSTQSRARVDSLSTVLPVTTSGRTHCVRDVCDAIIAQSFLDDGTKRSPDQRGIIKSRIASIRDGIGRYAFSDGSRHSSMSAGSIASGGAESPRSTSTMATDDDKQSISARDRLPARLLNVNSPADSPRSAQRNGLTLKELMDSPAIARNYRFDGLGGKSSTNTVDWTNSETPRTERRRSEENASIANYLSDEGGVERRRNQTFSAGNSTSSTSSSTQNLERLVASVEARKLMLRTIHEKQQVLAEVVVTKTEKEDSSKSEFVLEKKFNDASVSSPSVKPPTKDISPIRSNSPSSSDDDESEDRYAGRSRKLFIDETRKSNHDEDDDVSQHSVDELDRNSRRLSPSDLKQTDQSSSVLTDNSGCRNVIQNSTRPLTRADSPQLL